MLSRRDALQLGHGTCNWKILRYMPSGMISQLLQNLPFMWPLGIDTGPALSLKYLYLLLFSNYRPREQGTGLASLCSAA